MADLSDFLAKLNPVIARQIKTAEKAKVERIPLASIGLTNALNGGIPKGRFNLIYGNTGSGKSLLALQSIGIWQKMGLVCALFDIEGTYDEAFGARLGIDNTQLILNRSRSFGKVTDEANILLRAGIDVIVFDSISDAIAEIFISADNEIVEFDKTKQIGSHAKSCTSMLNSLHYSQQDHTTIVLISQTTTEIGNTYTKQVPHGGKKMQFIPSTIIKLTSENNQNDQLKGEVVIGDQVSSAAIGKNVNVIVEKSKTGGHQRTTKYRVYYDGADVGIDRINELVKLSVLVGVTRKSGAWYYWGLEKWQGEPLFTEWLKENSEMIEKLRLEIEEKL